MRRRGNSLIVSAEELAEVILTDKPKREPEKCSPDRRSPRCTYHPEENNDFRECPAYQLLRDLAPENGKLEEVTERETWGSYGNCPVIYHGISRLLPHDEYELVPVEEGSDLA